MDNQNRWFCHWPEKKDLTNGLPVHILAHEMRQNGTLVLENGTKTTGCGRIGQWFEERNKALAKHLTAKQATQERGAKAVDNRMAAIPPLHSGAAGD